MSRAIFSLIVNNAVGVIAAVAGSVAGNAAWEACKLTYNALTYKGDEDADEEEA